MIKDLQELQKFLKLCRKQGVKEIKFGDITVAFGDMLRRSAAESEAEADDADPEVDGLTPEQMAFYSVGGPPLP